MLSGLLNIFQFCFHIGVKPSEKMGNKKEKDLNHVSQPKCIGQGGPLCGSYVKQGACGK